MFGITAPYIFSAITCILTLFSLFLVPKIIDFFLVEEKEENKENIESEDEKKKSKKKEVKEEKENKNIKENSIDTEENTQN